MTTLAEINETLKEQNKTLTTVSDYLLDQIQQEAANRRADARQAREDKRESSRSSADRPTSFRGGFSQGLLGDQAGLTELPGKLFEFLGLGTLVGTLGRLAGSTLRYGGAIALLQTFGETAIQSLFESIDPDGVISPEQREEIASRVTDSASGYFAARFLGFGRLASLGAAIGGYYGEEISNAIANVVGSDEFRIENPFDIGPEDIVIDLNDPTTQTVIGTIAGGLFVSVGRALGSAIIGLGAGRMSGLVGRMLPGLTPPAGPTGPQPRGPDGRFISRSAVQGPARIGFGTSLLMGGAAITGAGMLDEYQQRRREEDIAAAREAAAAGELSATAVAAEEDISFWRRAALSLGAEPQNVTEQLDDLRRTVTAAAGSISTGGTDALTGENIVTDAELKSSLQETLTDFIGDTDLSTLSAANLRDIEAIANKIDMSDVVAEIQSIQGIREGDVTPLNSENAIPVSSLRVEDMESFREMMPSTAVIAPEQMDALMRFVEAAEARSSGGGGGGQTPQIIPVPVPTDRFDNGRDW